MLWQTSVQSSFISKKLPFHLSTSCFVLILHKTAAAQWVTGAVPQLGSPLRLIVPCSLTGSGNINGPWPRGVTPVPLFGSAHCFVWASIYLDVNQLSKSVTSCPCVAVQQTRTRLLEEVSPVEIGAPADCVSIISPLLTGVTSCGLTLRFLCLGGRTRVCYSAWWDQCSHRSGTILEKKTPRLSEECLTFDQNVFCKQ